MGGAALTVRRSAGPAAEPKAVMACLSVADLDADKSGDQKIDGWQKLSRRACRLCRDRHAPSGVRRARATWPVG